MTNTCTCACGRPATTQIQTGWDATANNGAGGGVYEDVCAGCYNDTPEAATHSANFANIIQDIHLGLYRPTVVHGECRWVGPGGSFFNIEDYQRLLTDPYKIYS